jgi:hypothetical protein
MNASFRDMNLNFSCNHEHVTSQAIVLQPMNWKLLWQFILSIRGAFIVSHDARSIWYFKTHVVVTIFCVACRLHQNASMIRLISSNTKYKTFVSVSFSWWIVLWCCVFFCAGEFPIACSNPEQSKHLETARMRIRGVWVDFVNLRAETYAQHSRIPTMVLFKLGLSSTLLDSLLGK